MQFRNQTWLSKLILGLAVAALLIPAARAAEATTPTTDEPEVMFSINIKQVLDSAVVKKYALEHIKSQLQTDKKLQEALKLTGLDPLKDLDSITVSGADIKSPRFVIVVRGKFDADKINAAMTQEAKTKPNVKSSKEGALTIWSTDGGDGKNSMYATVASRGVLLMSSDKNSLVKAATGLGQGKIGPELKSVIGRVSGKESFWVASIVNEEMKKQLASNEQTKKYADKLKAITGSLTLTDDVQFGLRIYTTEAKVADEIRGTLDALKPLANLLVQGPKAEQIGPIVKEVVYNLKIGADQTTVTIDLKLSEDLIRKIREAVAK